MASAQTEEKRYDVVIVEIATRRIDTIAGTNMKRFSGSGSSRNTADLRKQTVEERINDRYRVEIVDAGKYKVGDILPSN